MSMDKLMARGVSRRDFVKLCSAVTAALGLSQVYVPQIVQAAEEALKKQPVIWLEGQDCAGCSESTIATLNPSAAEVVLDMISLRYHEVIMAASGEVAEQALHDTVKAGGYVLVVEGSIPTVDDRFCKVGGKAFRETVIETAKNADAIIALGSCATHGGIPAAGPTGAVGVADVVKGKPIINLPSCPAKPSRLIATILHYLTFKSVPELDSNLRPLVFYGKLLHDNCPRRGHFENGEFVTDWNDPKQKDWCLLLKGCKGPKTFNDCAQVWWNDGANFCINAGSPCSGCTSPEFYKGFTPLYAKQDMFQMPGVGQIDADTAGKVIGGAAALGVGIHLATSLAKGRLTGKEEHSSKEVGK